jgi:hypothetical protein
LSQFTASFCILRGLLNSADNNDGPLTFMLEGKNEEVRGIKGEKVQVTHFDAGPRQQGTREVQAMT